MSYLQFRRRNEELHGLGCGQDCNCGPCKNKFSGFGEIYVSPEDDDEEDPEQAPPDENSPSSDEQQDSGRPAPTIKPAATAPPSNAAAPANGKSPRPPRMSGRGRVRTLHGFELGHLPEFSHLHGAKPFGHYDDEASDHLEERRSISMPFQFRGYSSPNRFGQPARRFSASARSRRPSAAP